jgi:hypothetical protein
MGEAPAGLAQASQSAAGISRTDGTASSVISDESIAYLNRSQVTISHRTCRGAWWHKVTNTNIVHCDGDFKSKVRLHREGIALRALKPILRQALTPK